MLNYDDSTELTKAEIKQQLKALKKKVKQKQN